MYNWLLPFGQWLESTSFGTFVRSTVWGYPYVILIHFAGLSLWVGTIAALDLRMLGIAGRRYSIADLSEALIPWTWTGLFIAIPGGFLLFAGIAVTYLHNPAFQLKLPVLLAGIVYHWVIQRKARGWDQVGAPPAMARLAGLTELLLWFVVVTAAVYIPNY